MVLTTQVKTSFVLRTYCQVAQKLHLKCMRLLGPQSVANYDAVQSIQIHEKELEEPFVDLLRVKNFSLFQVTRRFTRPASLVTTLECTSCGVLERTWR